MYVRNEKARKAVKFVRDERGKQDPMTYTIVGDPIPWARAAHTKEGLLYDSQKTKKLIVGIGLRDQHDNHELFQGPLAFDITFFMPMPQRMNGRSEHHCIKPDLDNLIKFICDTATGILFKDDCQISEISAKKIYAVFPKTEFTITCL